MSNLKKILTNRISLGLIAFVAGGAIATLFFQETILKKRSEQFQSQVKTLEESLRATKETLAEREKSLKSHTKVVKVVITKPDGTRTETTSKVTDLELVERVREEEKAKYESALRAKEDEYKYSLETLSIHKNPKRIQFLAGIEPKTLFNSPVYSGIVSYNLWGPFLVGVGASSSGAIYPMIGIRF